MRKQSIRSPERKPVTHRSALLAGWIACAALAAHAQQTPVNLNLVFLDPAHGGPDPGAHLTPTLAEKDVTLAFAARLRATLAAKGFSVLATRDGDTGMTSVQRAEMANHAHPLACLLLHATSSGSGVYLAASSLTPDVEDRPVLPWDTAQAAYLPKTLGLLDAMVRSVTAVSAKPVVLRTSVPPIDSLTCAAALIELAPLSGKPVTDEAYQQKVVDGLVDALVAWRTQETPVKPARADTPPAPGAAVTPTPMSLSPKPTVLPTTPPHAASTPQ